MNKLCEGRASAYAIWYRAAKRAEERRIDADIYVDIDDDDGTWIYEIEIGGDNFKDEPRLSFQEFENLGRENICITGVWIGYQGVFGITSTLEEITEIFKFTAPCINLSILTISKPILGRAISEDDLSRLLSFYRNATFRQIACHYHNRASEQFLIAQMETNVLKNFSIGGCGWTEELRSATEEFALNKDFESINVRNPSLVFGRAFFDALIQKHLFRKQSTFKAQFSFHSQELMTSGFQDIDLPHVDRSMRWIREDGVSITIRQYKCMSVVLEHPLM